MPIAPRRLVTAEKREDARTALEFGGLAKGQKERADRLAAELSTLAIFNPKKLPADSPITVGAIVEVEDESLGRTFFLAPVGAGIELTGPGGDGFLSVVTPVSPIGKAVLGRKVGDTVANFSKKGQVKEIQAKKSR